ncbi:MAG: RdgB/HAM1 family non-canonical purine NTP pyrophosphatase [Oligosphaeraceae bacterium]|jgi:XTP/dITP diphosphohydrolase|nr:RdgB/HAM1 family non-canonical purine NTP pyrophosphatase [Oligosphaeraceae bacterium]
MREIIAATGNAHKVREIQSILAPYQIRVLPAEAAGRMPEVLEDGLTFADNAVLKALAGARAWGRCVLADDSGLEVQALGGAPGVHSARYAGEGGNDGRNLAKLLQNLAGQTDRRARFVCVIALAGPQGLLGVAEGEVRGHIAEAPSGNGGFGYDPVFIPEGYRESFAALPEAVKNTLSHRSRALQAALAQGLFSALPD